jgi:hypothetical protein
MTKTVTLQLDARLSKGDFRNGDHEFSQTFQVKVSIEISDEGWDTLDLALPGKITTRVLTLGIPHVPISDSGGI